MPVVSQFPLPIIISTCGSLVLTCSIIDWILYGGFRRGSRVSMEPPVGLDLVLRIDNMLNGIPLPGQRTKKTAVVAYLSIDQKQID